MYNDVCFMKRQPTISVLIGLPFAGKTTLGKLIAREKHIPHVDFNEILVEQGLEGKNFSEKTAFLMTRETEKRAEEHIKNGKDVIYDVTPFTKTRRDRIRKFASILNAKAVLIFVNMPKEETQKRWEKNNTTHERTLIHRDPFMFVTNHFEPSLEEKHIVYGKNDDPEKWIKNNMKESDTNQ